MALERSYIGVIVLPDGRCMMPMFCLTNFYVLPSSLHELLIVPESTDMSVKELSAMVHEVNETQVAK